MNLSTKTVRDRCVITGVGVVGPFGTGRTVFRENAEDCVCSSQQTGGVDGFKSIGDGEEVLLAKTDRLYDFIASHKLRRTDHFSRLALTAACLALENADLESKDCRESGLVVATGYGPVASTCAFKDTFFDNGSRGASPIMFTKAVHNQATSHIAIHLGVNGPVTTVCQHVMPFQHALLTACLWLLEKRVERVLVGGVDEFAPFFNYCRYRYLKEEKRETILLGKVEAIPGEGAAFFVLELAKEGTPLPILELPTFSPLSSIEHFVMDAGCFIISNSSFAQNSWGEKYLFSHRLYDFRNFYGYFPTAAALDLAALTTLLSVYETGSILEAGSGDNSSHLQISSANSQKMSTDTDKRGFYNDDAATLL